MPTVREIAQKAGVSKSTVSLVLNNKPGVTERTRRRVLSAAQTLESQENTAYPLQSVSTVNKNGEALSIMVLHPPVLPSSYVFGEVLTGIQDAATEQGVQLRLVTNSRDVSEQHVSRLYLTQENLRPDGVLIFGAQQEEPLLDKIREHDVPCVALGREARQYAVSGIERDECRYARQATRHLLELGHQHIAFIGGELAYDFTHNRLKGYRQAMESAGIAVTDAHVCLGGGRAATQNVLRNLPAVTALLFVNDGHAHAGLPVLRAHRLAVPDDISIVSFDDTDVAQQFDPPLTSISYDRYQEGRWAVKALLSQIQHAYIERVQIMFKAQLVVRGSTAPPRNQPD